MLVSMADTIVARPGPPVAINTTTNNYPSAENPASLCPLCHRFTTDLLSFNFVKQATYFPPWFADQSPKEFLGDGFHHHASFSDLVASAKTCQVCAVFLDIFAPMPDSKRRGWLGLYPYCKGVRAPSGRRFVAAFSEALEDIGYDRVLRFKASPHVLSFCVRDAWGCDLGGSDELVGENGEEYNEGPGLLRAVSEGEEFETARRWLKECERGHVECNSDGSPQLLPKRVVDVGESEADKLVLYTSEGVEARYVALSHCWGGDIPGKTIKQNIASRCTNGIPLSEIPQNFRDAVKITRELGIRYLWIDALCIIQDCPDDWAREAAKMATVYAGATVIISALHSASSTDGILARPLAPLAILDNSHAIQRQLGSLADELAVCPLNSRGWCMQERLLSPRILHFGAQQMFWECRASHHCENGQHQVEMWLWDDRAARLTWWRKAVDTSNGGGERVDWALWRHVIEAYSARLLTDPLDKLPALAGAAEAFRASRGEGRMRKVGGPQGLDKCAVMSEPVKRRAPSWS
ncbi:hypothetical protein V490_02177 [Pseudogymnoascus sp. VKM F-3557]|nr:hypothetical protein V490_02177 [Pseudogymnoascus sp. VKM F-3557]